MLNIFMNYTPPQFYTVNLQHTSCKYQWFIYTFGLMGPGHRCFPYQWVPIANLRVQNTIFNDKSAILLHPGTRWNKNFASQRQNYAQKMQDAQVTKSLKYVFSIIVENIVHQSLSCWIFYVLCSSTILCNILAVKAVKPVLSGHSKCRPIIIF